MLTSAGEAFVTVARRTLRDIETLRADVAAVADVVRGHLDLVALPTLAVDPLAPLVGRFRTAHPGVIVRLAHPDDTDDLFDFVRSGRSEIGITQLPRATRGMVVHPFGRQELFAVLPPGSQPRRTIRAADLARIPLVTQPVGTSTRDTLDAALPTAATVAVITDQREAIVPLVIAGAGAALLPAAMASTAARDGAIVAAVQPKIWRDLALIHRTDRLTPAAIKFLASPSTP